MCICMCIYTYIYANERGTIRLETLIDLKLFNSSFSNSIVSIRAYVA